MLGRKKFSDIKSLINLSLVRLNAIRKKASDELAHKKRILAKNIQDGEMAQARLEAERIVKLDWKVEALNLIEIKCEEVRDNVPLLQASKEVPYDLDEAVSTIIYSRDRANIPELKDVVSALTRKYGREYVDLQVNNDSKRVDERLVHRLSGERPNAFLVYNYMKEIAKNFNIEWNEDEATRALGERFDMPMTGSAPGVGSASGLGTAAYAVTDGRILPKGEKPKGFVPPAKPDFDVKPAAAATETVQLAEVVDDSKTDDNDDDNGSGSGSGGGDTDKKFEAAPPPLKKATPPPAAKPKPAATPKKAPVAKAKPKPAPVKKAENGVSDLEARFAKLRDL